MNYLIYFSKYYKYTYTLHQMSDDVACRICLEDDGILISPCGCKGSAGKVHEKCLKKWVAESGSDICEICQEEYARHEVIGCNVENYCSGIWQSKITSEIEGNLIRISALHCLVGLLMYAWSTVEYWMLISSIQTVVHTLCIILFQIFNHHVEFFVLRVCIYWSIAYLIAVTIIGTIRTMDYEEECTMNCWKVQKVMGCTDECIVYNYYTLKNTVVSQVMMVRFVELATLLGIRCIALCFTHMKRSKYYSFNRNADSSIDGTTEEEVSLLP